MQKLLSKASLAVLDDGVLRDVARKLYQGLKGDPIRNTLVLHRCVCVFQRKVSKNPSRTQKTQSNTNTKNTIQHMLTSVRPIIQGLNHVQAIFSKLDLQKTGAFQLIFDTLF